MARPERNNVDYFPFLCKEGKAMYFIEQKYGNDGYSVWIKLLRQIAVTNYHYLNLSDQTEMMFISSKCRVTQEVLINIIDDLCTMGEFHQELWSENRVLWSEKFIEHIQEAYKKRNNKCITLPGLRTLLPGLRTPKPTKSRNNSPVNTQTRVEYSKEEKSRGCTHPLCVWIQTSLPNVSKLKFQLTDVEAERLIKKIDKRIIHDILEGMENKPDLTKGHNSVNLTIQSWYNYRKKKNPQDFVKPPATQDLSEMEAFYNDLSSTMKVAK